MCRQCSYTTSPFVALVVVLAPSAFQALPPLFSFFDFPLSRGADWRFGRTPEASCRCSLDTSTDGGTFCWRFFTSSTDGSTRLGGAD
uniref:Putative secreted protein n=1 Tax=Ixodes ricinus TaxID=34613 RepID=A0A6B0UFG5_IXORI